MGVYEKVDKFNDLLLNCLGQYVPIISFKLQHKSHPCFNGEIKQRIIARKKLHSKARRRMSIQRSRKEPPFLVIFNHFILK